MTLGAEDLKEIAAEWRIARAIHPIYLGIAERFALEVPPCKALDSPIDRADPQTVSSLHDWLRQMDGKIQVHQLRLFLQTSELSTEARLRALARHFLKKHDLHTAADRDKLDFLLVQYFAQCAPNAVLQREPEFAEVARVLEPVIGAISDKLPAGLEPLEDTRRRLLRCGSMREVLRQHILNDVRKIKDAGGEEYFALGALVAFARLNYLVRQAFFRLMRADLDAIRWGVRKLISLRVQAINCERAQLSSNEPLTRLLELVKQWKKPFQAEYSAGNPFAQLAELRAAVDAALVERGVPVRAAEEAEIALPPSPVAPIPAVQGRSDKTKSPVEPASSSRPGPPRSVPAAAVPAPAFSVASASAAAAPAPAPATPVVSPELQGIVAQLKQFLCSDPGRSRTEGATLVMGNGRLALSSWEVTAFVEGIGEYTQVIQEGVAARVLVFHTMQQVKQGAPRQKLVTVRSLANTHAVLLEHTIKEAREERNIEASVTLSATSQRLTSILQDAEKMLAG